MATLSQLRKQAAAAPKFILFTNQFGFDIFIADSSKTDSPVTGKKDEALEFSQGFDNEKMKLAAWSFSTGYNLQTKYL